MGRFSIFLPALLFFLLFSSLSLPLSSTVDFSLKIHVSGGSGEGEILEYPQSFAGQNALCTSNRFSFPPYEHEMHCTVWRFPARDMEFLPYPTDNYTEWSKEMEMVADELRGENEIETAMNIAEWIRKNVKYDLGLGERQENAEWAFQNRVGTCDEIAHLFIALARAAGLNARYVSGFALGDTGWLPHAWAEVWTSFGWLPFDIPFEEYGFVDGFHIITYKGKSGDHEFIKYRYEGETEIDYKPEIEVLDYGNLSINGSIEVSDGFSGGDVLLTFSAYNPLDIPIGFPVEFKYATGFRMEKIFGKDYLLLYPGKNTAFFVFRVPRIPSNSIYKVPILMRVGEFTYRANFTVYGWNHSCKPPEPVEEGFKLNSCLNLRTGILENLTSGGDYFCDSCYFHIPTPINFTIIYTPVCYSPCNISIELRGVGYANVSVNNRTVRVPVQGYRRVNFQVNESDVSININGAEKKIQLRILPPPEIQYQLRKGMACFNSTWEIEEECVPVRCGETSLLLSAKYENYTFRIPVKVFRQCTVFELLLEKVISFFNLLFT